MKTLVFEISDSVKFIDTIITEKDGYLKVVETIVQDGLIDYIVKDYYQAGSNKIIDTIITTKDGCLIDDPNEKTRVITMLSRH